MAGKGLTTSPGLTLVELLVVVAIIGTACGLVFVSTAEVGERQKLEGALHRVADTYAAARASAVMTRQPVRVVYDVAHNRMSMHSGPQEAAPYEVEFDEGLSMTGVSPSEDGRALALVISPTGRGRSHLGTMECRGRLRGSVSIDGLTGRAEIAVSEAEAGP